MLPLPRYLNYVQNEPDYFAWMILEGAEPVGAAFMQIEPDQPQSFAHLVKPELRNRGYGRRIVAMLLARPEAAEMKEWKLGIEPDNIASQRSILSNGFTLESEMPDHEGLLQYVYRKS